MSEATPTKEDDFRSFLKEHQNQQNLFFEKLFKNNQTNTSTNRPSKLIKVSKPPAWTKEMSIETYKLQVERWSVKEADVPETEKFHELIESLKSN